MNVNLTEVFKNKNIDVEFAIKHIIFSCKNDLMKSLKSNPFFIFDLLDSSLEVQLMLFGLQPLSSLRRYALKRGEG